jgi:site-specific recombinase XerD
MAETLRDRYAREMTIRGYAASTKQNYMGDVELMVRRTGCHPAKMTRDSVAKYFAFLIQEQKVAPSTYRQHVTAIALFFRTVLHKKFDIFEEARPRKRKKLPNVLSLNEVHEVIAHIIAPRYRTGAVVQYTCGLRISELVGMRMDWIESDGTQLHVKDAKGGRDRLVPLPARTLTLLREHWSREKLTGPLFFPSPIIPGRSISGDAVRRAIRKAAQDAGIVQRVATHTLRHCYATHLLERGVDIQLIKEFLGHRSIETTSIYTHLTTASIERAHEALDLMTSGL